MIPSLDVDVLRSFIAIADFGSFTRAASEMNRTQSAISMQMKRLEDVTGRPLFIRDGRQSRITPDGERLLDTARRIVKLNDEVMHGFIRPDLTGTVRLGVPDDYADALLPGILARFARTHPLISLDVECEGSRPLNQRIRRGELDLALLTCGLDVTADEIVSSERLVWVTAADHRAHEQAVLPLALSSHACEWRSMALTAVNTCGRPYRTAYSTASVSAILAAVQAGLAVGAIPAFLVRPGLRVLTEADGFPALGRFDIGISRAPGKSSGATEALARHIGACLAAPEPRREAAE